MRELERSDRLQVARLAEIGMNSAALLHEMRQPLAAVKLALQMASKEISSQLRLRSRSDHGGELRLLAPSGRSAVEAQFLEDALAQVDRLAGLLDRAHSFMQPGSEALTEFELEPVVRRVVRLLEHSVLRKSIELVFTARGRPFVRAAVPLVEQILFNLINNARDSLIERGGGGRLAVIILQDEESAEVIIGDDGVGIPDDYRSSIFAPYMTTKGKGGTGLGLYVARRLAGLFGGRLTLVEPERTKQLMQPPLVTALALRMPLGATPADTATRATGSPGTADEAIVRLEELRQRPARVALLCQERWISELLSRFLQPIACALRGLSTPQALTIDDAELLLVVPTGTVDLEESLHVLGRGGDSPAVIAVLSQWDTGEALRALRLGCVEAIKVPTGNLELLAAQAAVLAALQERRGQREAELLLAAWARTREGDAVRDILARTEPTPLSDVVVCGSEPLRQLVRDALGDCRYIAPDQAPELERLVTAELLFVEPEAVALSRLLEGLQLPDAGRVVICAERLSLREVQHALSRGVFRMVSQLTSAPQLARERIAALAQRLQRQRRLDRVLQQLMRPDRAQRTASRGVRQRRVLVVDDEQVILKILEAALRPTGCAVVSCTTGREATHLLETQPVDLLIADKNLPDITGLEVARTGRLLSPELGVLIITGFPSQPSAEEALQLRVDDYLVKPFDVEELIAKVGALLAVREANEPVAPAAQRPPTVVLAEPDLPAQALLSEVFATRGERLLSKGTPAVALEVLRDQPAGILVVSVDRDLSREEHALLHEARRSSPRMVVLATATRPDLGRTLEALRVGATALLHKPLADLPTLLATIQRACDG